MKKRNVIFVFLLGVFAAGAILSQSSNDQRIEVRLKDSGKMYLLGEPIVFDVQVENLGNSDTYLRGADAQSGYVQIFVSRR